MKRILTSTIITLLLLASLFLSALAQNEEYRLNVHRNFGYSAGNQIKGSFSIDIVGPTEKIKSVRYLIDGKLMADVNVSPFGLTFDTSNYPYGDHQLSATLQMLDGSTVNIAPRLFVFATPEQEAASVSSMILPILGLFVLITGGMIVFQVFVLRKRPLVELAPGTPRNYGLRGGTVCPRCHRPFVFHWWGLKLVTHRFERCDYCGKTGMMRGMSQSALRAAEQAELTAFNAVPIVTHKSEEDKLKEMLDQSRFTDHS